MVRPPFWWSLFGLFIVTHNATVSSNKGSLGDIKTSCEVRSPVDIILYWKQATPRQNVNVSLCPSDQSDDRCIKEELIASDDVKSETAHIFTNLSHTAVYKAVMLYDLNNTIYNETVDVGIDQCWKTGFLQNSSIRCELRGPVRLTMLWKQNVTTLRERVYLCLDDQIASDCIKGKQTSYDGKKNESTHHLENVQPNATYKAVLASLLEDKTFYNKTTDIDIDKCLKQGCRKGKHLDHNFVCDESGVRHCEEEMIVNGTCLVHHHTKVQGKSSVSITLHVPQNVDSDYQLNTSHEATIKKTKKGWDVNFTGLMPGQEVRVQMLLNKLTDNDTKALQYIPKAYSMSAAPSNLQGHCTSPGNITLRWNQTGFCATTLCSVCPALGPEDTCVSVYGPSCGGAGVKKLSCALNVQPDVIYNATVEIYNGAGDKVTSEATVNCSSTSKPAAPSNLKGQCDSQGNVTLTWNQTGLCTEIVCRLCPSGESHKCFSVNGTSCGDSGTKELSCTVRLPHGVRYNAFVEIHSGGVYNYSVTTVNCCPAQAAPSNLQGHCNSRGNVTLTWNQTGLCTRTVCRLCPDLKTEENCTLIDGPGCGNTGAEEKSCTLKVEKNTKYTASVVLFNTTGCETKLQTTVDCYSASVPVQPTGLQSTWKAPGEITLGWTQKGPIAASVCKLCPLGKPGNFCISVGGPNSPDNGTTEMSCDFTLQQDVKYNYVIEVYNSDGEKATRTGHIDNYFNSKPVRDASVTGVGTRSVNVSMKASCTAMRSDVRYVVVNISHSPRCLVFGAGHTECSQENLSLLATCERQPDISTDVCEGDEDRDFILPVSNLTPSTAYTLLLVPWYCGYNHGNENNSFVLETTTDSQEPWNVNIVNVTSSTNTVTVIWPLPDLDPGPVNYTLHITDAIQAPPGVKNTNTVCRTAHTSWPFTFPCHVPATRNTTTGKCTASVPYAFWNYSVAVVVETPKGSSAPRWTSVESSPQAPGPVAALNVSTKNMSDLTVCGHVTWTEYSDVCVMWKETCPHQRGNFIHGYLYRLTPNESDSTHQVNSSLLLTHGNDAVRMRKDWNETSYFKLLTVATDTHYTFCVCAVGPSPDIEGTENCIQFYVPTIKPSLSRGGQYKVEAKDIPKQTHSHRVTFTMKSTCFMVKPTYGEITDNGFIISKGALKQNVDLARLPSWYEREQFGYYKTKPDIMNSQSSCSASKSVVVGKDVCPPGNNRSGTYCDGPLDPGTKYSINAMVCTKAGCSTTTVIDNIATPVDNKSSHGISLHTLVAICLAPVLLTAICFLVYVILRAKRRQGSKTSATEMTLWQLDPSAWSRSQAKKHSRECDIRNQTRPIPLSKLEEVIKRKEQGDSERLREEFKAINNFSRTFPVDNSTMDYNRGKNRFADIFAYDHSRVQLIIQDEEEGSDYINANFIPGYNREAEYIASQGPLPRTKDDMWRMVWEYRVPMIIMLTQTQEKGRVMCEEYWPCAPGEARMYGQLCVTAAASSAFEDYIVTRLLVKHNQDDAEVLQVLHLQYLVWPDMTADVSVDSIVTFLRVVRHLLHDSPRPLVVHCSAGVGRTGTFICLDYVMQFIRNRPMSDKLDIFKFILHMREYRCRMVQTVNQYIFIHNVARHLIAARKHAKGASKSHVTGHIASSLSEAEMMLLPRASDESVSTSEGTELIEADMKEEDVPEVDKFLRVPK